MKSLLFLANFCLADTVSWQDRVNTHFYKNRPQFFTLWQSLNSNFRISALQVVSWKTSIKVCNSEITLKITSSHGSRSMKMNENYLRLILWKEVTVLILWMAATTCEWIGEGGGVELRLRGRDLLEPLSLQIRLSLPPKPLPIGSSQQKFYWRNHKFTAAFIQTLSNHGAKSMSNIVDAMSYHMMPA